MKNKGQGAFEYILMLAGVLLIVVLIILILQGNMGGANTSLGKSQNLLSNMTDTSFFKPDNTVNLKVSAVTGQLTGAAYPCCSNGVTCGVVTACTPATVVCPSHWFNNQTGLCS